MAVVDELRGGNIGATSGPRGHRWGSYFTIGSTGKLSYPAGLIVEADAAVSDVAEMVGADALPSAADVIRKVVRMECGSKL